MLTWHIDMHVHFYGCYNYARWVKAISQNLARGSGKGGEVYAVVLTEGLNCDYFSKISNGIVKAEEVSMTVIDEPAGKSLKLCHKGEPPFFLFPGRQVCTKEKIEIIGWLISEQIPSGRPAEEVIQMILEKGGFPAINWAPGKWIFKRGRIIKQLIDKFEKKPIFICDTAIRPSSGMIDMPVLMRYAQQRGIPVAAGSDPFPIYGEERRAGCYKSRLKGKLDEKKPTSSLAAILASCRRDIENIGVRNSWFLTFVLLFRLSLVKCLRSID